MCGRYTLSTPGEELTQVFGLEESVALEARFNIAPTQISAVVRVTDASGKRELAMLRWGLVPYWARDRSIGDRLINARAETASEKPAFRESFRKRRCLVLADGFYEWRKLGRQRQPFYFSQPSGGPFAMAGLWDTWRHGAEPLSSFTIITTEANDLVGEVHGRMPAILAPEDWAAWLQPRRGESSDASVEVDLGPAPEDWLRSRPVSTFVNSPTNDSSRCVEAIDLAARPQVSPPGLFDL